MRTMKFRGKRLDNRGWVTGYLYQLPLPSGVATMILTTDNNRNDNSLNPKFHLAFTLWVDLFPVDAETVGQFTGMKDKNGKELYEGDVVHFGQIDYEIRFYEKHSAFTMWKLGGKQWYHISMDDIFEIFANIHDNPELLK